MKKKAAMVMLAMLAAVAITAGGVYAASTAQSTYSAGSYQGLGYGHGLGPSMIGGYPGHGGNTRGYAVHICGMVGGHGIMGDAQYSMPQDMWQWWNSTSVP